MSEPAKQKLSLYAAIGHLAALGNENKFAEAYHLADRLVAAVPENQAVLTAAGIASYRNGDIPQAIERLEKAEAMHQRNMCEIYRSAGQLDNALRAAKRAIELAPDDPRPCFSLSLIHYERLELDAALAAANRAIELDPRNPEPHFAKAEALLLAGRLEEGWESYEWRFQLKQASGTLPKTGKPQWDGQPMAPGRLLIFADQGYGDAVQFARFIPWAAGVVPQPIVACSAELAPLLRQFPEAGKIVTYWGETPEFDAFIPLSGLPRLAGINLHNIPPTGYLTAPSDLVAFWKTRLDQIAPSGRKRVAIVWSGRPTHKNDKKRRLGLAQMASLFEREDLVFIALQKGDQAVQANDYQGRAAFLSLGADIRDFLDTLAILQNVDRLVSIDTAVTHLAGASNVPASVVLPYAPDWRWLLKRDDSPWYPSLKLYRQDRPQDWSGVIERVAADI